MLKGKKRGFSLEAKTFEGNKGGMYLVFRTLDGSYHTFAEVEAKQVARECGATEGQTRGKCGRNFGSSIRISGPSSKT
jgi:hypothetical protein